MSNLLFSKDPQHYITLVRPFLESKEDEYGVFLGNLALHESNPSLPASLLAYSLKDDEVTFAAYYRDLNLLICRGSRDLLKQVAKKLLESKIDIAGVFGPTEEAKAFSQEWMQIRECQTSVAMDQMLYKLNTVIWPIKTEGSIRVAEARDAVIIAQWEYDFLKEALPFEATSLELVRQNSERRISSGMTFIWEVDEQPVSITSLARPTTHGIAIIGVYTPPEHRKKGYAAALVATVSAEGLKRGKDFCTLYTDLSNPTSNSIYRKIGYYPVCGACNYRFQY